MATTIVAHGHDFSAPPTASMADLYTGLQSCSLLEEAAQQQQQQPGLETGASTDENDVVLQATTSNESLGELPDEVLLVVASYLDVRALGAFAQVDRRIRAIAEDDALWREMFSARFMFRPVTVRHSWKMTYCEYLATPRWHPTQKHCALIIEDDGLVTTMPTPSGPDGGDDHTDNRSIRAAVEYAPGSGLHYFEVQSLCPNDVSYHPYVGICSTTETVPVEKMLMWLSEQCYAYGGNGTLYSSSSLEGNHQHLGKYRYGDKIGVMVDYRKSRGWLTFYLNKVAVSNRMRITGTWFPCVGMFHPRHAFRIVVRPEIPKPIVCSEELADA